MESSKHDKKPVLTLVEKVPFYSDMSKQHENASPNIRLLTGWDLDLENLQESMLLKFFGAAQHNQLDWVQHGVQGNIPLDLIHEEGHTVLTVAAQFGAKEVTEYLLDIGLNPAFFAEKGMHYNAYFSACAGGQFDIVDMLLNHPNNKVTLDMVEPRHHQSGLQVAVHNLQFDCAKQMIETYPALLTHLDELGRTAFGTALSIFVTTTFTDYVEKQQCEPALEDFCLYMLRYENPFQKVAEGAIPSIQVIIQSAFATFHKGDRSEQMTPLNAVRTIFLACPRLGEALLELAQKNPKGILEHHYTKHATKHLADMEQLRKNQEKIAQQKEK